MSAIEDSTRGRYILLPSDFAWLDANTLLVHQGAVWLRAEGMRGRVLGFTVLCTDDTVPRWKQRPATAEGVVTCFGCLGASEQ